MLSTFFRKTVSKMNDTGFGEVDSVDFAVYLNRQAQKRGIPANVTKIQKWLYICYGAYLAVHERQLLTERPKAWDYGPAFPRVHKVQKKNKNSLNGLVVKCSTEELTRYDDLIKVTLDKFGDWTASELVTWTHEEDKAWHKTFYLVDKYAPMDNYDIMYDFRSLSNYG